MRAMEHTCNIPLANDEIGYIISNGVRIDDYADLSNPSNRQNPSLAVTLKSFYSPDITFEEFYDALSEPQYDDCELALSASIIAELKLGLQGKSQQWKLTAVRISSSHTFCFDLWDFKQTEKSWEVWESTLREKDYRAATIATSRLLPYHVYFYLERDIPGVEIIINEQAEKEKNAKTYGLHYYSPDDESQEGTLFAIINEYSRKKCRLKRQLEFRRGVKEADIIAQIKEYSY